MAEQQKPECAVRGMVRPGAMCSKVIVGQQLCGFAGQCEHQRPQQPPPVSGVETSFNNQQENPK